MKEYHKIQTCFKRDEKTKHIIENYWTLPEFEFLKDNQWVFTEKVDGTNIRVMWNGESVVFGGKTDNASIPVPLLYELQKLFEGTVKKQLFKETFLSDKDGEIMTEVCLYGEGYGAKIQKGGGHYSQTPKFVLFDVKIGDWFLLREDVEDIAKKLGIDIVPIVGQGTLTEAIELVRKGQKSTWGDFIAEGLVLRPATELKTRRGDRLITKIKHKDFF
jgi:hypothetical protein